MMTTKKEKAQSYIESFLQDPSPQVFSKEEDEHQVWVDGILMATAGDLVEAIAVWFSTFYIFNIHFPVKNRNMLNFMLKALLQLKDGGKTLVKVFNFIKKIDTVN